MKIDISAVAGIDHPDGADDVELNLFTDKKFAAVKSRFKRRDKNHFTWYGKVSDDPQSMVVLVAGEGQMQGIVFAHGKHYSIRGRTRRPRRSWRSIRARSQGELRPGPRRRRAAERAVLPASPDALADTGATIDVLVVYTRGSPGSPPAGKPPRSPWPSSRSKPRTLL